jgi:cystathionine beta-lyase family protein involved in aluminum resistance
MNNYLKCFNIDKKVYELVNEEEKELKSIFTRLDEQSFINSSNILNAFYEEEISESDFCGTTGYGYGDIGRDKIERVFARVLKAEDALVRNQFISGSHALTVALFASLRPNDILLSISGLPYDTLHEVIGIKNNNSSLASFNIKYEQIDLINNDFDYEKIIKYLKNNKVKVIEIQRSRGYSSRLSLTIDKIEKIIKKIREVDNDVIILVDNCYCELVEDKDPLEVGADLIVGSLIKNLGGGIASNGAYIAGKKELVNLAGERLTLPGEGKEVGPSHHANREFLMGLYHAPSVVNSSLKIAILTSKVLEKLGYEVSPRYNEERADIVQSITFNNSNTLIKYCEGIQSASAIDAKSIPEPTDMPGYDDKIIMASGSFTQGSSIEISCDGPLREPYMAYQQGGLTYEYGKIALMSAISRIINK